MKNQSKLNSQEQEQVVESKSVQMTSREFGSVEEVLREDAKQTEVPPEIARRLGESLRNEPRPERSWWQRLTGS